MSFQKERKKSQKVSSLLNETPGCYGYL